MQEVLRSEKKYLIGLDELLRKGRTFPLLLHEDPHNGSEGYLVRSLYFDTADDGDFFDKVHGVEVRRKLRLRIYDPSDDFAVLEMKQKQGVQQRKRSLRLPRAEAERLIAGDDTPLLSHADPFAAECYVLLHSRLYCPKTIVQYRRRAFIARENSTRVTFDHRIDATETSFDLFDPGLLLNPVLPRSQTVLEVKYNGFLLSYIKQVISTLDRSELSVSKYCLARQLSYAPNL